MFTSGTSRMRCRMDRREYEFLQERFSKLLAKKPYGRANEKEAYRSGVRAAKSVLKEEFYKQQERGKEVQE